ncbi:DNA-binding response regulator [Leptolyngbyaceae cyanobacterium CCMR0082]|uniref:DNA-binding response regulator n=2 Tax=Adonisia turfae TaxID=2950184 RepID=A0A6M0S5U0_9CYAN|nr:response regulator transcription factor [Adonisia turfae]NEZ56711.1 DNA-binding response regulator [Adonisia turfae CCMR0081]NEZ63720.1 DNA-binding response regulator [Adonisia turfae CCMR0082]
MATAPIRVLLVEDHALMRRGLSGQFRLEDDFEVVGEAENGQQAIELAAQLQPDIILMDIEMPILDGISATQAIKATESESRVLALSAFGKDSQVVGMLAAGADGYCLKSIEWQQLIAVLRLIQGGGTYLAPQIAHKLSSMLKSTTAPVPAQDKAPSMLTDREREVLQLISEGCSNQEIADQLYLSLGTIKAYVRTILNKLSVDDRVQAAAKAVREGLI